MRPIKASLAALLAAAVTIMGAATSAHAAKGAKIDRHEWSFSGFSGRFDKDQLQRGFQVYQENCAACHGLERVRFRNLVEPGGPEFPEDAVKGLAAEWPNQILDGPNDEGEMFERPAKLFDPVLGPYRNDEAARAANNGALPPDLSLIVKARTVEYQGSVWYHPIKMFLDIVNGYGEAGADYLYALLTSYKEAPANVTMSEGMYYNVAYPGSQIAMPAPLSEDVFIEYQDGTGSYKQNAEDVTAFLAWAADPHLNQRKDTGWMVMLYLLVTTVLLYLGKKRIWARAKK